MNVPIMLMAVLASPYVFAEAPLKWAEAPTKDLKASLSTGVLTGGESIEYVFSRNQKQSQLNWKIDQTPIIKADLSWQLNPQIQFNINGWHSLSAQASQMDDYDWLDRNHPNIVTHWSTHPDTQLNQASQIDLNLSYSLKQRTRYQVNAVLGLQRNQFNWEAHGGSYQYAIRDNNGNYNALDPSKDRGDFAAGRRVVAYQQQYTLPYVGLSGRYRREKLEFNARLKYSAWVTAEDIDQHDARRMTFRTKAKNAKYTALTLNAGYWLRPNSQFFTEISWTDFDIAQGTTTASQTDTQQQNSSSKNGGGLSSRYYTALIGLQYRF
ncbi:plasminogen activator Pla [Acinetobacter calcoaceticus]|uniref:Plasminogen activator Pla n=1 Tax=Acinetobacter calcoaceticus TaxID=471 RepID=A0A4V2R093_ACICA|nr:plasminogen activator Pla [Acinetobacter calcoaceticus]